MKAEMILGVVTAGLVLGFSSIVYAGWGESVVAVNGGIGSSDSDFSLGVGDSVIEFSRVTDISSFGGIAISDEGNGRVKIYSSDGNLKNILVPPVDNPGLWTYRPIFINENVVIPIRNYYFYDASGSLLAHPESPTLDLDGKAFYRNEYSGKLYVAVSPPTQKWLAYSSTGELLNTYTEKPLIMGRYEGGVYGYDARKLWRTTIEYPETTWVRLDEDDGCREYDYVRDAEGNVYCRLDVERRIKRFNACGRLVADFYLPDDDIVYEEAGVPGVEPYEDSINAVYGDIVLGDNGDLYSSRVSDTRYEVVRWPWQASPDDPNGGPHAPDDLAAQVNDDGVAMEWRLSPQDAGCVTGYEIGRATAAGGPYAVIGSVEPAISEYTDTTAQAGTTYYYAVRAISSIANSEYSSEVSVQLQ